MTNARCSSQVWYCFSGFIKNVLLSWRASCTANAIMQQCSVQGYLAWMVTKWEMFGHSWSAGFVYFRCPRGSCVLLLKQGFGGCSFTSFTEPHVTSWYTKCLVGHSAPLHAPAHTTQANRQKLSGHMHSQVHTPWTQVHPIKRYVAVVPIAF